MIKTVTKMEARNYTEYYCDKCGKFIGETEEYPDGYEKSPDMYSIYMDIRFDGKHYVYRGEGGAMCEDCFEKAKKDALRMLAAMGFKEK
mgnify:CR=1 FL=1